MCRDRTGSSRLYGGRSRRADVRRLGEVDEAVVVGVGVRLAGRDADVVVAGALVPTVIFRTRRTRRRSAAPGRAAPSSRCRRRTACRPTIFRGTRRPGGDRRRYAVGAGCGGPAGSARSVLGGRPGARSAGRTRRRHGRPAAVVPRPAGGHGQHDRRRPEQPFRHPYPRLVSGRGADAAGSTAGGSAPAAPPSGDPRTPAAPRRSGATGGRRIVPPDRYGAEVAESREARRCPRKPLPSRSLRHRRRRPAPNQPRRPGTARHAQPGADGAPLPLLRAGPADHPDAEFDQLMRELQALEERVSRSCAPPTRRPSGSAAPTRPTFTPVDHVERMLSPGQRVQPTRSWRPGPSGSSGTSARPVPLPVRAQGRRARRRPRLRAGPAGPGGDPRRRPHRRGHHAQRAHDRATCRTG